MMKFASISKKSILYLIFLIGIYTTVNGQANSQEDFKVRGFHIDFRNEVMTPQALKNFAKELAGFGINTLIVEWEATYPYEKHAILSNDVSYTRSEVKSLDEYCKTIGIDLIPVQESFGHVQYILRHDRYSKLRVTSKDISQVCACDTQADSLLFHDLFSDMASLFSSKYIFIGGDETRALGECALCKQKVDSLGKSRVYADYMKMMANIVLGLGKIPVMWDDMILKYPESADEIPKETIMVDWNYGWKINHFGDIEALQKRGFKFWGAPSIRSHPDNWYVTDWNTHFKNQKDFIPYARKAGYEGMVMTSWSTSGLYGFTWDVGDKVIDMEPIRNNYPLSGFRILIASFAQALKQQDPIDPEKFVVQYAKDRFGLNAQEGEKLWETFMVPPELIQDGKPQRSRSIAEMRDRNNKAREILNSLHPKMNNEEFSHYRLMADLRDFYLAYSEIEAAYNAEDFSRAQAPVLLNRLNELIKRSKEIDRRFYKLNKGFLFDSEIEKQDVVRNKPLEILRKRLMSISRTNNTLQ